MSEQTNYYETLPERSPEEIQADTDAQNEARDKLSHLVSDSVAVAYYKAAIGQPKTIDSLFWQGRFAEAAELAIGQNKTEYQAFDDALVDLDMPVCSCEPIQFGNDISAKGTSVPSKREIQRVYVGTLQKEVKFIKCDGCQEIYAETIQ